MSGNGPVQRRLLLAVGRVGDCHPLLAPLSLHGRDVEDEIGVLDSGPGLGGPLDHAVLTEGVADAADFEVGLRHLDLAAHGGGLARVLAVRVRIAGFEEDLVLLAFSEIIKFRLNLEA